MDFKDPFVKQLIDLAIAEDIGDGDHSSLGAIDKGVQGKARLIVKDSGIICGIPLAKHIMQRIDKDVIFNQLIDDVMEGRKYMKVYRQMKMYNDDELNPVLRNVK